MLGRTQDQIRTTEQVNAALTACNDLKLDGLVIVGGEFYCQGFIKLVIISNLMLLSKIFVWLVGVTSNTDAAQLAETFAEAKCQTKVTCMTRFLLL